MKDDETRKNDVKEHQENVEKIEKSSQKNIRISVAFSKQFLDEFDKTITYFGYSRSSAILEACVKFMKDLCRSRLMIERNKKLRDKLGYGD